MQHTTSWREYWQRQVAPLHRKDADDFYARHAAELRALFDGVEPRSVLEIGCGTGALYTHLRFDTTAYHGVDFSDSMLGVFSSVHPDVSVSCADGSRYRDDRQYDLIFSNGVVQYFDRSMLARHFENVRAMMHPGSLLVCASIPWRLQRTNFLAGELTPPYKRNRVQVVRSRVAGAIGRKDPLGHWYDLSDIDELGRACGLAADFFGSVSYLYRFHAVLRVAAS